MTGESRAAGWGTPDSDIGEMSDFGHSKKLKRERKPVSTYDKAFSEVHIATGTRLWHYPDIFSLEETDQLDEQDPETLYFLANVVNIPKVVEVYVEHRDSGKRKHWTVISERDFQIMDQIYNVEMDVLNRFPGTNPQFRVTIQRDGGPSVADKAYKIYDAT